MKVYENDKIQLQTPTKKLTRLYILKLNVPTGMHFFFFFNSSNRIIFTIRSINLFLINNLRLYKLEIKYLIDDMAIVFLFS